MAILPEHKEILSTQSESKTLPEWVQYFEGQYTKSQIYSYCYHNGYMIKKLSQSEKSKPHYPFAWKKFLSSFYYSQEFM